ncbi:Holliday junction DNA helicase RuvA [Apilactobacillus ozensis DSM 23829 = JCM 17196]|uniref:Holliday junction branch migration complex subunit RuvA n=1 Tax=Apilactobacillus ozensis DSM 23829 = JCM 17196 TaxID=1423781 RepID=A0A0R2AWB4_9LACO|nr:Holliday junction branch migration protein RuvA [Apilactobacillus ozensis]KRM68379.1 Holliday junction DNA helicase RuvA [Apilactobacillus ozensis DSM 23829 = JCM 17196]
MFEYLNGYIVDINPKYIVLDVSGVGYLVYVSDPYRYEVDLDNKRKVYVHQVVTDSFQMIYGFYSKTDKTIFEKLINVSGIGPKSALAILVRNDHRELLNAINTENVTFLTKFPGVGKKTAKQIILDLKGKLDDIYPNQFSNEKSGDTSTPANEVNAELKDALDALVALGYTKANVEKVKLVLVKEAKMTTDEYLSAGLKILM